MAPVARDEPEWNPMNSTDVIVCSFYTADDYYRGHAKNLRSNLDHLGVAHELREIEKHDGEDWADICRKKIGFLNQVCVDNPDSRVFWIDVDCKLMALPDFVQNFTADIIGFQRGFGNPLTIGYERRTRFWEPCFFGINTSERARKFMSDAAELEKTLDIKATDDYFFEESWRTNAAELSFQVIPSLGAVRGGATVPTSVPQFFIFGASGNVAEFKGKVVQHERMGRPKHKRTLTGRGRAAALDLAKRAETTLPGGMANTLRRLADTTGVTGRLVGSDGAGSNPERDALLRVILRAGQRGDLAALDGTLLKLQDNGPLSANENAEVDAARSFAHFAVHGTGPTIPLIWWAKPSPGNFGDWLAPLVVAHFGDVKLRFQEPASRAQKPHLISVGSIGRFIKPHSIVVGTGISSADIKLAKRATYVSVRGPLTAEVVAASGGPEVTSFGDPGVLLSRIFPVARGATNGRLVLVRHFTHSAIPLTLPDDVDELPVLISHPDGIKDFVETLNRYDGVVTSAMHVMIACHSYGIPCVLVAFEGFAATVHGTGIKYEDYSRGAGLSRVYNPEPIRLDLTTLDLRGMLSQERVSDAKLDEIEEAVRTAVRIHASATSRV